MCAEQAIERGRRARGGRLDGEGHAAVDGLLRRHFDVKGKVAHVGEMLAQRFKINPAPIGIGIGKQLFHRLNCGEGVFARCGPAQNRKAIVTNTIHVGIVLRVVLLSKFSVGHEG